MKKYSLILMIMVTARVTYAQENIFFPTNNTSFLTSTHHNEKMNQDKDSATKIIEDNDYMVDEYDSIISVQAEPVPLSPLKQFLAHVFGKMLIYYFSLRDTMDSYYKKYRTTLSQWLTRLHGNG